MLCVDAFLVPYRVVTCAVKNVFATNARVAAASAGANASLGPLPGLLHGSGGRPVELQLHGSQPLRRHEVQPQARQPQGTNDMAFFFIKFNSRLLNLPLTHSVSIPKVYDT